MEKKRKGATNGDTVVSNKDIAAYYDTHQFWYSHFWSPAALHYGFWYEDTKDLAEAILNTNKFVIDALWINHEDVVLDAGCGVGGSSIYIAETTGARVEGVTLSEVQLKIATERAGRSSASDTLRFSLQDYTCTNFGGGTFSKIFGIESICHANKKIDFLKEAYRLMQPGGKIAVADAFLTKEDLDAEENNIYTNFIEGWVLPNLATKDRFQKDLLETGFTNVLFRDMHDKVKRSSEIIYNHSRFTYPFNLIGSKLGLVPRNFSARYQKEFFDRKIAVYGVFVAEKTAT